MSGVFATSRRAAAWHAATVSFDLANSRPKGCVTMLPDMSREHVAVGVVDRICFLRWSPRPTGAEVRGVADAIARMRREVGRPLILVAVIPSDAGLPDREGREELVRLAPLVERTCEIQYAVLEGDSFVSALVRGIVVAVIAAMRVPVVIVGSVEEALGPACARLALDVPDVLARAREGGLLPS